VEKIASRLLLALHGIAAVMISFAVISGARGQQAPSSATVSDSNRINVWVDATRKPGVEAYMRAHPDVPVNLVLYAKQYGSAQLQEKFSLWNRAGNGWPDAIFFGDVGDMAWASSSSMHYAATLNDLIPKSIQDGFSPAAILPCVDGKRLVCMRNDIAPDVLWFNAKHMSDWGYTVPATWPDYEALGLRVAKEHPGWFMGAVGDSRAIDRYFWASGCPLTGLVAPNTVHINVDDPKCTRVVEMLDKLLQAKVISTGNWQATDFVPVGQHLLAAPGATWYGPYLIKQVWQVPAGQMSAAPPLSWPGEDRNWTGSEGGGMYVVSSHISGARLDATVKLVQFMSTDIGWLTSTATFPAYGPAQKPWLATIEKMDYFADFPALAKAFVEAGTVVRPDFAQLTYSTEGVWQSFVVPALVSGQTITSVWRKFGERLEQYAHAAGYKVQH
jgi:multiple sugar transport system substrate-binding protein